MTIEADRPAVEPKERPYVGDQVIEFYSNAPEFIPNALTNLPEVLHPVFFDITFASVDSENMKWLTHEQKIKAFEKAKVIPWSTFKIEWESAKDAKNGGLFKASQNPFEFGRGAGKEVKEVKESVLQGFLPERLFYKASSSYGNPSGAYKEFIENDLPLVLNKGIYHIHEADLALSTYRKSGYDEGTFSNSEIIITHGGGLSSKSMIRVQTSVQLPIEKTNELNSWITNLVRIQ